ncbi:MAG: ATP-binding protein [Gammaproteobacteria bacterium]|nr:ATP-binding protein [Gammaproteobacteria bacterium]
MAITALKRFTSGSTPVVLLIALLLASLYLLSGSTQNSVLFDRFYSLLLGINILAILLLFVLIGKNIYSLFRQYRSRATGSRLTTRLVIMFIILSVTPVSVVYYFSLQFLQRGIDSWFDIRVEKALGDAIELSQASLGIRMQELLRETQLMAEKLQASPDELVALALNDQRSLTGAAEMTIFTTAGKIIASSSKDMEKLIPQQLADTTYMSINQGQPDIALAPLSEKALAIRIAVELQAQSPLAEKRILQALFEVPERINILADSVQTAFGDYNELAYLRIPLKYSFILTLSLVLLLSILTAIWAAFYYSHRMMAPITDLVEGTRAVADGDYDKRLPLPGRDELGFLVHSFNEMTDKIARATNTARINRLEAEQQNAYLEVVLAHLNSGVLTFDEQLCLHTTNATAEQILNLKLQAYHGKTIQQMANLNPRLQQISDMIDQHLTNNDHEWREEITLFGETGRQIIMLRGTTLPHTVTLQGGHVVVFDDITNLLQAQRNAAWGEVARRLAHEIKNPLTPIQLSAERLRHKYLQQMDAEDAELLDRSTHTIVQQVETLKQMVKAFSDYARMPKLQLEPLDLNRLIAETRDLYSHDEEQVIIQLSLEENLPLIEADTGRMRQLLHNLIKNALEVVAKKAPLQISLSTRFVEQHGSQYAEVRVIDNGPGIPEDMLGQLFEPYVTSKPKGTGLGLAIVKKIVEEHGGIIHAESLPNSGASIILHLPVLNNPTVRTEQTEPETGTKSDAVA